MMTKYRIKTLQDLVSKHTNNAIVNQSWKKSYSQLACFYGFSYSSATYWATAEKQSEQQNAQVVHFTNADKVK